MQMVAKAELPQSYRHQPRTTRDWGASTVRVYNATMIAASVIMLVLLCQATPVAGAPATQVTETPRAESGLESIAFPEMRVNHSLEELRKSELLLDALALGELVAASLTVIDDGMRLSGSFAYLEPMRRLRERGGQVRELQFQQPLLRVYGSSAIVTYRWTKVWIEDGVRRRDEGWGTDVFELRDDDAWILVMRHRASDRPVRSHH